MTCWPFIILALKNGGGGVKKIKKQFLKEKMLAANSRLHSCGNFFYLSPPPSHPMHLILHLGGTACFNFSSYKLTAQLQKQLSHASAHHLPRLPQPLHQHFPSLL